MPVDTLGPVPSWADVGDTWRALVMVSDTDGTAIAPDSIAVTVTLPTGATATGTATAEPPVGIYLLEYDVATSGDHVITITVEDTDAGDDVLEVQLYATALGDSTWDPAEVITYLGDTTSATAAEVADALAAETAAQRRVCRIPVPFPDDLRQALKRRVARNLAARMVPVASFTAFDGGTTSARVPASDVEVRRLEAPYRRLPVA